MKKLYRVTFHTPMLIEASNEREAERIGYRFLVDEVHNGSSEVWSTEHLEHEDQLYRNERGSYPWRSTDDREAPQETVEEILRKNNP